MKDGEESNSDFLIIFVVTMGVFSSILRCGTILIYISILYVFFFVNLLLIIVYESMIEQDFLRFINNLVNIVICYITHGLPIR